MAAPVRLQHPEPCRLHVQSTVTICPSMYTITCQALLESDLLDLGDWQHPGSFGQHSHVMLQDCIACTEPQ